MEKRELETTVRPVQDKDIKPDNNAHTITFADYVERLIGAHYNQAEKDYLNRIFMTRKDTLKPRRKDSKSETRAMLAALAKDYEEFMFDTIRRRMEEQNKVATLRHNEKKEDDNNKFVNEIKTVIRKGGLI